MTDPSSSRTPTSPQDRRPSGETYVNVVTDEIVADDSSDDSEYEATIRSNASIASSVLHYQYENGRRYHSYSEGRYIMPNDESEQQRLDLVHHMFLVLFRGELYLAPIGSPQTILDLGTGTGIWAMDIADAFPTARVIGCDLSAIQPPCLPPNLEFVIDDFEQEWVYPENYFDFVHGRTICGCVQDWPHLLRQAYTHLRPGGYVEMLEHAMWVWCDDGTLKEDSPHMQWLRDVNEAGDKTGRPMNIASSLKQWMIDTGFEDVTEKVFLLPMTTWPKDRRLKEVGLWESVVGPESIEAYGLRLYTQVLGWDAEEARALQEKVKRQLRDKSIHTYSKVYGVYGRKPR